MSIPWSKRVRRLSFGHQVVAATATRATSPIGRDYRMTRNRSSDRETQKQEKSQTPSAAEGSSYLLRLLPPTLYMGRRGS